MNEKTLSTADSITALLHSLRKNEYPENYLPPLLEFLSIPLAGHVIPITTEQESLLQFVLFSLQKQTPVEYIVNEAHFYRRPFFVNKHVLIPRNDTEPLMEHSVELISKMPKTTIIDCGTGSGALIVTLALELATLKRNDIFIATDISETALEIARKNATTHKCDTIQFSLADVIPQNDGLDLIPETEHVFIITNPPYIPDEEMEALPASVKNYEPELALRRSSEFIEKLQTYCEMLHSKGKKITLAIEYSKKAEMHHFYTIFPKDDLRELLLP